MALYIFDKYHFENGAPYAKMDEEAKILLLSDALYANLEGLEGKEIYAIAEEVALRGVGGLLPESVKKIDYSGVVDLIAENKVINFT